MSIHTHTSILTHIHTHTHTRMVRNAPCDWESQSVGCTHIYESLSRQNKGPPSPHKSSILLFERSGEKAAFITSNLSWKERRDLSYPQVKWRQEGRRSTPAASLKHVHAKCMSSHLPSLPSSVSHFPVSLCILLLRDWAVGRRLQSSLFRITANWRC